MTAINTTNLTSIATLTLQQFKDNYHNSNNTADAYYTELATQGATAGMANIENYAILALGVVNNDTTAGQLANGYSESVADDNSVGFTVGSDNWLEMQYTLMQADAIARSNSVTASGTGELDYEATNTIHTAAFSQVGLPPEAFTLYTPTHELANVDPSLAQATFEDMLTNAGSGLGLFVDGIAMNDLLGSWAPTINVPYWEWIAEVVKALVNHPSIGGTEIEDIINGLSPAQIASLWPNQFPAANVVPTIAAWLTGAQTPWSSAFSQASPLVLDLTSSHTGIALTTFSASTTTTFFDIDGSGFSTQTAWVGADQGLLCRDMNSNGRIDNAGELFGSPTVDGFALLATLDSNGDHRIDQFDSAWSTLKIWVDANGDAVTQSGELFTLGSLNVASIDLAAVAASTSTVSGNPISHTSFFTFTSGATATVADAWFVHDKVNSYYAGDYTLDVETLFLPTLRGFGTLPDLAIAESQDSTLKGLVSDLASGFDPATAFANPSALNSDISDILYRWAAADTISSSSRGAYIDAQHLAFLEKFFGVPFIQNGIYTDPFEHASDSLNTSWEHVYYALKAALLTQAGADAIYGGTIAYDPAGGTFSGSMSLSQDYIDALQTAAPTDTTAHTAAYWEQVAEYIGFTKGFTNLTSGETTMLDDAIYATDSSLSWDYVETHSVPAWVGLSIGAGPDDDTITGTSSADIIDGGAGNDIINGNGGHDVLHGGTGDDTIAASGSDSSTLYGDDGNDSVTGGTGDDTIYGGDGRDTLYGLDGNDTLDSGTGGNFAYGGAGNDTYIYAGGNDVYSEYGGSGTDTILLPAGIDSGDLTFARTIHGGDNLLITVGSLGTIEISAFFAQDTGHTIGSIEGITFADTSTLAFSSLTSLTTYGTDGVDAVQGAYTTADLADTVYGYGGDDVIITNGGADYIDGGVGNDVMRAGAGSDTYAASPGYDSISDDSGTLDTILMPTGVTADDIHLLRHSSADTTLEITVDGLGQINVLYQFSGGDGVEQIQLSDTTTINLTTHVVESIGTTGNDTIYGILSGASTSDVMDGREGNDDLNGGSGNDTYTFSAGHDNISDTAGTDVLIFGDAWTPGDISVYRDDGANLVLDDGNGNTAKILSQYYGSSYSVETAHFSDSTTWNLLTMQIETHGTSGNDNISSYSIGNQDDIIYGYGGNDQIQGGDGTDVIYGGDGNDTLFGMSDADTLDGGDGNDYLYGDLYGGVSGNDMISGGDGSDYILGGGGADTCVFKSGETGSDTIGDFSTSDGDKIDLHDLLVGYDPLTSAITDFVHVTSSSGNAIVSVDANGSTGGASFTQIATLSGLSSLAGHEADLLANGNLIAQAA